MKSTIPTTRSLPDNRELSQPRKKSVTQEMGTSLFEQALAAEKRDTASSEVGYGLLYPKANAHTPEKGGAEIAKSYSEKSEGVDAQRPTAGTERAEQRAEPLAMEEEPLSEESAVEQNEAVESRSDAAEIEAQAANENSREGVEIEGELESSELYEMSEIEADAENTEAGDELGGEIQADAGLGNGSEEEASEQGQQFEGEELFEDVTIDSEVFGVEKNTAVKAASQAAANSSVEIAAPSSDLSQTGTTGLGREAFARATTVQRAANATQASPTSSATDIDMQEVVDQIEKARGTMSGSRARVVLGEGSDRIAMMVSVKNGVVDIDLKASDAAIADALANGSEELSSALSKHGLSLGDMGSDADGQGNSEFEANGEGSAPTTEYGDNNGRAQSVLRRGVRVVA